jgi:hypothetical protein
VSGSESQKLCCIFLTPPQRLDPNDDYPPMAHTVAAPVAIKREASTSSTNNLNYRVTSAPSAQNDTIIYATTTTIPAAPLGKAAPRGFGRYVDYLPLALLCICANHCMRFQCISFAVKLITASNTAFPSQSRVPIASKAPVAHHVTAFTLATRAFCISSPSRSAGCLYFCRISKPLDTIVETATFVL